MRAGRADLYMLNVVGDMAARLDLYGHLWIVGPQGKETTGTAQVARKIPGDFGLELEAPGSARMWQVASRANAWNIGISLPSGEAIGERYRELTAVIYPNDDPWEEP
jgi:hypothetical protein